MPSRFALSLYALSTWIIPLVVAITFHEAAHGFVARLLGDNTAWLRGRVTFNPLKHIHRFGTILLPALLIFMHSPFLFGYGKPVPVNFGALKRPKRDSRVRRRRGPGDEFRPRDPERGLHSFGCAPADRRGGLDGRQPQQRPHHQCAARRIRYSCPIPPLDGGRILVGLLPRGPSRALAWLKPYGMIILIAALIVLPALGAEDGDGSQLRMAVGEGKACSPTR